MKVSVSLPDEDVEFLDRYAAVRGVPSRSAALQRAVRLLRASELGADYDAAWLEWTQSTDGRLWDATARDGFE